VSFRGGFASLDPAPTRKGFGAYEEDGGRVGHSSRVRGCSQHCYLGRVAQKDNVEARAGRELQHPFLPPVVCAILAVGAAVGAFSASGILQVILIVLAVLLSAYTAMLYVAGLLHSIMSRVRDRPRHGQAEARTDRGTDS
jgi:hypothetical protein